MTRIVVAVFAAAAALAASAPAAPLQPRVWISSAAPVVVRGTGFHAGARVAVAVSGRGDAARTTTLADLRGAFAVRVAMKLATCQVVLVTATDSRGARVVAHRALPKSCGENIPLDPPVGN